MQKTVWGFFPVFTRNRDLCLFRKIQFKCQKPIWKQTISSGKKCKMSLVLLPHWMDNFICTVVYRVLKESVKVANPGPWLSGWAGLGWQVPEQQCWRHGCSDSDSLPSRSWEHARGGRRKGWAWLPSISIEDVCARWHLAQHWEREGGLKRKVCLILWEPKAVTNYQELQGCSALAFVLATKKWRGIAVGEGKKWTFTRYKEVENFVNFCT